MLRSHIYVATLNAFTAEAIAVVALMTLKLDWVPAMILVVLAALIGIALAFAPGQGAEAKARAAGARAGRQGYRSRSRATIGTPGAWGPGRHYGREERPTGIEEDDTMVRLADLTVNFTLNDLAVFLILGGLAGLATGYLMKSKGAGVLLDLLVGFLGGLVGGYLLVPVFGVQRYGLTGAGLLAIAGGVLAAVIAHFVVMMRHKAKAS